MEILNHVHEGGKEELEREIAREQKEIRELEDVLGEEVSELKELEKELDEEKLRDELHIFVNKIRYTEKEGVKRVMTGIEIVELVPIDPPTNADLTREGSDDKLPLELPIHIRNGECFEAIRKTVVAG